MFMLLYFHAICICIPLSLGLALVAHLRGKEWKSGRGTRLQSWVLPHQGMRLTEVGEPPRFQRVCWKRGGSYHSCNPAASNLCGLCSLWEKKSQVLSSHLPPYTAHPTVRRSWPAFYAVPSASWWFLLFLPPVRLPHLLWVLSWRPPRQLKFSPCRVYCILARLFITSLRWFKWEDISFGFRLF